jgi:hypothetical protein
MLVYTVSVMAEDKGVSHPGMGDLLSSLLQSIDSILCKSFHAHHPVHLLPCSLSILFGVLAASRRSFGHPTPRRMWFRRGCCSEEDVVRKRMLFGRGCCSEEDVVRKRMFHAPADNWDSNLNSGLFHHTQMQCG